jgi:HD-GYP domain-containing protein (c-di-GMP phosphodiesterase class II)
LLRAVLAAQVASDFVTTAAREWAALSVRPKALVGQMRLVFTVDLLLAPIGFLAAIAGSNLALLMPLPLLLLVARFARERTASLDSALELSQAYRGTALLLGDVIEADDAYTGSHSRDVVSLALAVADELGLLPRDRRDAEFAALLHDVGKIRIDDAILNKPGPLTPEERAVMETHTIEGELLLETVGGLLGRVGHIVRSCHERWDGAGYPDGLAGEEIPLVARIVCCCDAYNATTTDRPYRKALATAVAVAEIETCAGSHFDPEVAAALVRVVSQRREHMFV